MPLIESNISRVHMKCHALAFKLFGKGKAFLLSNNEKAGSEQTCQCMRAISEFLHLMA